AIIALTRLMYYLLTSVVVESHSDSCARLFIHGDAGTCSVNDIWMTVLINTHAPKRQHQDNLCRYECARKNRCRLPPFCPKTFFLLRRNTSRFRCGRSCPLIILNLCQRPIQRERRKRRTTVADLNNGLPHRLQPLY